MFVKVNNGDCKIFQYDKSKRTGIPSRSGWEVLLVIANISVILS